MTTKISKMNLGLFSFVNLPSSLSACGHAQAEPRTRAQRMHGATEEGWDDYLVNK